jgi:hypothetical protein
MIKRIKAEVQQRYDSARSRKEVAFFQEVNLVELVGIEPPQWIENMQLADSTMFSNG